MTRQDLVKVFEDLGTNSWSIKALDLVLRYKDPYTYSHHRNVMSIATQLSTFVGLDRHDALILQASAVLHDIGKIDVPTEILTKPTALTEEEYTIVKLHVETGRVILEELQFPSEIIKVVEAHHERLDGSGYPNGLKESEIPLLSQILGICDVTDAILSRRPYKSPRPLDDVYRELDETRYNAEITKFIGLVSTPEIP